MVPAGDSLRGSDNSLSASFQHVAGCGRSETSAYMIHYHLRFLQAQDCGGGKKWNADHAATGAGARARQVWLLTSPVVRCSARDFVFDSHINY